MTDLVFENWENWSNEGREKNACWNFKNSKSYQKYYFICQQKGLGFGAKTIVYLTLTWKRNFLEKCNLNILLKPRQCLVESRSTGRYRSDTFLFSNLFIGVLSWASRHTQKLRTGYWGIYDNTWNSTENVFTFHVLMSKTCLYFICGFSNQNIFVF